nr:immunoglobulin light chain junction region [Macaca mulatta]MOW28030.1 immunoglobulin light chain junction region [Macaca mulatta]MOW28080.1 immunoglobulin light chain junction region [Macaca mulatta]MOW28105.1 immunoglobulin light chain junction region [Macaca mulatta]MOW28204.1 immunoglobulin light chain junction region [Macaca mulatta]
DYYCSSYASSSTWLF